MTAQDLPFDPAFAQWLADYRAEQRLPDAFAGLVGRLHQPLAAVIAQAAASRGGLTVVGLCGPQGSGKTTMVQVLARLLYDHGLRVAVLSLDDLYHTRAERQRLAAEVHPLFATRGPPGTHDVALGAELIASLAAGLPTALPRFDKARDDRRPHSEWPQAEPGIDVLLFEGWCVGARPEDEAALNEPINTLEREEDPAAIWRRHVNAALAGDYAALFARIDLLALMRAPSFETVRGWRLEQEAKLREATGAQPGSRVMSPAEVLRFMQFYERTTRHIDREMPARADIVVTLDAAREVREWRGLSTFTPGPIPMAQFGGN